MENINLIFKDLNKNEIIEEIKENKLTANPIITNKLWRMFIKNDGLMTVCLESLFEEKLKMVLHKNSIIEINNFIKDLEFITNNKFTECNNFVERLIEFKCDEESLLFGLSYWNENIYNEIMKNNIDKPIGLVMKEKEIEFYRTIQYYIYTNKTGVKFITRISSYKIKKQLAFILLEIITSLPFEKLFGQFD
jgi:chorismate-pyruvate lyase